MIRSKLVPGTFCKVRIVDINGVKHYVKRLNTIGVGRSYIVSTSQHFNLDNMVEIDGSYHFRTLSDLHDALNSTTMPKPPKNK